MIDKTTKELCALLGLTVEINIVSFQRNVPDEELRSDDLLTVHDTANTNAGADARMHRQFVKNGGGSELASFTYSVDDKRAVQILNELYVNYAQGGTPNTGNYVSMSIETCIAQDENWQITLDNLAKLVAALTVRYEKTLSWVVQHNHWWGKDCPGKIRHEQGRWEWLLTQVQLYVDKLKSLITPPPPAPPEYIVLNKHTVQHGFLGLWNKYGLEVMGYPLSDEYIEEGVTYQDFENVVVQWYQGIEPRICAGVRKYKYERKA